MRNRTVRIAFIAFLLLFQLYSNAVHAKSFEWDLNDIRINVLDNGDMEVSETQQITFSGVYRSGFRTIPIGYPGRNDGIEMLGITEDDRIEYRPATDKAVHTYTTQINAGELVVNWYFEPTSFLYSTTRSFVFRYLVRGGIRRSPQNDNDWVLFWKAIPPKHIARINRQIVTVTLPAASDIRSAEILADEFECPIDGIRTKREISPRNDFDSDSKPVVRFERNIELPKNKMLEIDVVFSLADSHSVNFQPPKWQKSEAFGEVLTYVAYAVLCLVLALPLVMCVVFRPPKIAAYVPPMISEAPHSSGGDYLSPASAAALINNGCGMKSVLATVVDLARRGYLTIVDNETDFTFVRQSDPSRIVVGDSLRSYESLVLSLLFPPNERSLQSLKYQISGKIPQFYSAVYTELVTLRLWRFQFRMLQAATFVTSAILIGFAVYLFTTMDRYGTVIFIGYPLALTKLYCYLTIFTAILLIAIVCSTSRFNLVSPTTNTGELEKRRWQAYARWLANVNADPIGNQTEMQSEAAEMERPISQQLLETNLSYAIAFGTETALTKKIERLEQQQQQQQEEEDEDTQQQQQQQRPPTGYPSTSNNNNNNNNNGGSGAGIDNDFDSFRYSSGRRYHRTHTTIYFPHWYIPRTSTTVVNGGTQTPYSSFSERMGSMLRSVSTTFSSTKPSKSRSKSGSSFSGGGGSMGFR